MGMYGTHKRGPKRVKRGPKRGSISDCRLPTADCRTGDDRRRRDATLVVVGDRMIG